MAKPNKQPIILIPEDADAVMKANIRHFVGLLICEEDVISSLPHRITTPTHLPLSMQKIEGVVLDTIYLCHDLNQPPNKENVIHLIESAHLLPDPAALINELVKESDVRQPRNVALLAHTIDVWINESKLKKITELIPAIRQEATLDYSKKFQRTLELMMQAAPDERNWEQLTEKQIIKAFLKANRKLVANKGKNLDLGPELPFKHSKKVFGYMEWGEITTIMAQTGFGKTTLGVHIAEHVAWKQRLSCDVHMFLSETSPEVIGRRQISRHLLIPYQVLKNGDVDFDDPKWKAELEKYTDMADTKTNTSGYINMIACPGANSAWITTKMHELAHTSHQLGRSSLFILDYLQRFDWQAEGLEKYQAFEVMGNRWSNETRMLHNNGIQCHTILFAQEGDNDGEAFGSKFIRKISQLVMVIRREKVEGGVKNAQTYPDKRKDALGNVRNLCNVGDEYSHRGSLDISKANDAAPSRIQLWFEGPMSNITEDPNQTNPAQVAINPGRPQTAPVNPAPKANKHEGNGFDDDDWNTGLR